MSTPRSFASFERHAALWSQLQDTMDATDLAHDADHVLRVYRWAVRLAPEAGANPDLAGAAALVHDLDNVPKESEQRTVAGTLSAVAADPVLAWAGYAHAERAAICDAVANSSWSAGKPPGSPVGTVLQDADRLDAIGAIGIARTYCCAQGIHSRTGGQRLYCASDPADRKSDRAPEDKQYATDHFRAKLLRLAAGMHLPSAQREAEQRQRTMEMFLDALQRELL